jgi:hypothetical protein
MLFVVITERKVSCREKKERVNECGSTRKREESMTTTTTTSGVPSGKKVGPSSQRGAMSQVQTLFVNEK